RRTLLSPTLGGHWTYKSATGPIEVQVPAILTPQRRADLLDALASTATGAWERRRDHELSGRLFGECGGAFHGVARTDANRQAFYKCANRKVEALHRCECPPISAELVEASVWAEVTALL